AQALATAVGVAAWAVAARWLPATAPRTRVPRTGVLWGLAAAHVTLVQVVGALVTHWARMTDDEDVYLMQARMLLHGAVTEPAPPFRSVIDNPFVIDVGLRDGMPHWAGCYPIAAPLLTAPGLALGFPHLLWTLLGGVAAVQVGRLAPELWP